MYNQQSNDTFQQVLSDREIQVIRALMDGSSYKEAGVKLGISPSTINMHNYSAFKKIGVKNIVGAINYVNKYYSKEAIEERARLAEEALLNILNNNWE